MIGAKFAVLFGNRIDNPGRGVGYGLAFGATWWVLGPLTLMPLFMGMGLGVNWNFQAATQMLPSLVGHLVFGALLGWVYSRLQGSGGVLAHSRRIVFGHELRVAPFMSPKLRGSSRKTLQLTRSA